MRWLTVLGVVLIVIGLASLVVDVVPFHHTKEVARIGSLTATQDKETDVYIPRYASAAVVVVGVLRVFASRRRA